MTLPDQCAASFTAAGAEQALNAACHAVDVDSQGAALMRIGENALFHLPRVGLVARIARSEILLANVAKEVAVARWLEDEDFPAVRAWHGVQKPIVAAGRVVTFWTFVTGNAQTPSVVDLAVLLRRLHDLEKPQSLELPTFDVFERVDERLSQTTAVAEDDLRYLRGRLVDLRDQYEKVTFDLPPGHIHGDAHPGNIVCTDSGPILIDFERFAVGPREWDLSVPAIYCKSFGWISENGYEDFVRSYGFDVTGWPDFPVLQALREFTMTTWLMQNVEQDQTVRREFSLRMASLREGTSRAGWHAF